MGLRVRVVVLRSFSVGVVLALVAAAVPAGAQEQQTVPQTGRGLVAAEREAVDLRRRVDARRDAAVGGAPGAVEPPAVEREEERADLRTEHSRTFELSDGSFETELFGAPVHFDDGSGPLDEVDTRLRAEAGAARGWRMDESRYRLALPQRLSDGPVVVREGDAQLSVTLVGAADAGPAAVDGDTAVYQGVADGVDARLTATATGVKEDLVLAGPESARSFVYDVTASAGLTAALTPEREVVFRDPDGRVVFAFKRPVMTDARRDRPDGPDNDWLAGFSDQVDVALEPLGEGWRMTVTADDAWLDDPDRQWPVTLDPTTDWDAVTDCHIVSDSYADTNFCSDISMRVGAVTSGSRPNRSRVVLGFGAIVDEFFGDHGLTGGPVQIRAAELALNRFDGYPMFNVDLHEVTQSFNNGATWNRRTASSSWSTAGGSLRGSVVRGATNGLTVDSPGADRADDIWVAEPGWMYWYPTQLVQDWVDGDAVDHGFGLKAQNESVEQAMWFRSSENTLDVPPRLRIQWSHKLGNRPEATTLDWDLTDRAKLHVDPATGNARVDQVDVRLPGVAGHDLVLQRSYNSLGGLVDAAGNPDEFAMDFGPGWRGIVDSTARLRFYAHDSRISLTDPTGRVLTYLRTTSNQYTATTRTDDTLFRWDNGSGFLLRHNHTKEEWGFNPDGLLRRHTDRNGNDITYFYTGDRLSSIEDSDGRVVTIGRNAAGRITLITDPAGEEHRYGYNAAGFLTSYTDPTGATMTYGYTGRGQLSQISLATSAGTSTTRLTYHTGGSSGEDAWVRTVTQVAAAPGGADATTTFAYAQPFSHPDGDLANTTKVTDPRGNTWVHDPDRDGRIATTVDPQGHRTSRTFTSTGSVASFTDGNTNSTVNTYSTDGLNNLLRIQAPTGASSSLSYADANNPSQPTSITDPQGNVTEVQYDATGRTAKIREKRTQCPGSNCDTDLTYDSKGRVTSVKDMRGNTTSYTWNDTADTLTVDYPGPINNTVVEFDALSRVEAITDGRGLTTRYTYDEVGRVTRFSYASGVPVVMDYDQAGNLVSQSDVTGTKTISYDVANRVRSEVLPGRGTNTYTWDANGNAASFRDVRGVTVTYAYTTDNALDYLLEPGNVKTDFSYDRAGNRTQTVFPNGVTTTTSFDNSNRTQSITTRVGSASPLVRRAYDYRRGTSDTMLRHAVTDESGDTITYDYDRGNRLTSAVNSGGTDYSYGYDAAYNLTSRTAGTSTTNFTVNAANQVTAAGSTTFTYDGAGNLTGDSNGKQLRYNAAGQLTGMKANASSEMVDLSYAGDGNFERVSYGDQEFSDSLLGTSTRTGGSTPEQSYIRDNEGRLIAIRDGSTRRYVHADALGSVAKLTNESGAVTQSYTYDPYGITSQTTNTGAIDNPWRFTGAYHDTSQALYKMGVRYMQPTIGKWTQPDPALAMSRLAGANPYAYGACDPVNNTDPTGAASRAVACFIGGTALAIVGFAVGSVAPIIGLPYLIAGIAQAAACTFL